MRPADTSRASTVRDAGGTEVDIIVSYAYSFVRFVMSYPGDIAGTEDHLV
jgi:hypothetical protein